MSNESETWVIHLDSSPGWAKHKVDVLMSYCSRSNKTFRATTRTKRNIICRFIIEEDKFHSYIKHTLSQILHCRLKNKQQSVRALNSIILRDVRDSDSDQLPSTLSPISENDPFCKHLSHWNISVIIGRWQFLQVFIQILNTLVQN